MEDSYKLDIALVGHGNCFNIFRVVVKGPDDKIFLETGEYVTEIFDGFVKQGFHWPLFKKGEVPPYGEKSRFVVRALNSYKE